MRSRGEIVRMIAGQKKTPIGYLTFWSPNAFAIGCYNSSTSTYVKAWNGTMEYSTDTVNWSVWSDGTPIYSNSVGDKNYLYVRGIGNSNASTTNVRWNLLKADLSGLVANIHCVGSIETVLDYAEFLGGSQPSLNSQAFREMFKGQTGLVEAPDLTPLGLSALCYLGMFYGCTSLITAPNLPATTMKPYCYNTMFFNCLSLVSAPKLPATTLATECYYGMFRSCQSLSNIPELPAITLQNNCYGLMFYDCKSLKLSETQSSEYQNPYRIPTIGAGTDATNAMANMFYGTGGTFKGTPTINTTYYTNATIL